MYLAIGAPNIEKVEQESWGEQHPTEEPKLLAAFFKSWVRCRRRKLQRFDLWPNCVGQIDKDVIGSSAMHFLCFVLSMTTCHAHLLIWYFCLIACLLRCFVCLAYLVVCSFICCVCSFALISATNARIHKWQECLKNYKQCFSAQSSDCPLGGPFLCFLFIFLHWISFTKLWKTTSTASLPNLLIIALTGSGSTLNNWPLGDALFLHHGNI